MNNNTEKIFENPQYKNFYNTTDLEQHTYFNDCWVSISGKVLDLSQLLIKHKSSPLAIPILQNAGKDISHWFDPNTMDPKTRIDIDLGKRVFFTPEGRFLHIPPKNPIVEDEEIPDVPWWRDEGYVIGRLTTKSKENYFSWNFLKGKFFLKFFCLMRILFLKFFFEE